MRAIATNLRGSREGAGSLILVANVAIYTLAGRQKSAPISGRCHHGCQGLRRAALLHDAATGSGPLLNSANRGIGFIWPAE
jgi:hypothetical protein